MDVDRRKCDKDKQKQSSLNFSIIIIGIAILAVMILGLYVYITAGILQRIGTITLTELNITITLGGIITFISSISILGLGIRHIKHLIEGV